VDRDVLVQLLDGGREAFSACRQSVLAGGRVWVSDDVQPASGLARIYRRRAGHTQRRGVPTLGFSAAVQALHDYGERQVRLGAVDVDDPPYHFQLFFDENLTSIVACLGVDQDPGHRVMAED
jgi:hypothetical protein